jgi:hypothetical protein
MMTTEVFLLTTGTDYQGETPRGVYSSMEKALVEAHKIKDEDTVNIYVVEVDYNYDYDLLCLWSKRTSENKVVFGHGFETKND